MNINDDGLTKYGQQSKGLRFLLFDGINCGAEILKQVNINACADPQSLNSNGFSQDCFQTIQKVLAKSIFKAERLFQATINYNKNCMSIAGIFDKDLKETAAVAMIAEFDNATGPAQIQVINEATQKFIESKNEELHTKITRLKNLLKKANNGASKASTASTKKRATKTLTFKTSKESQKAQKDRKLSKTKKNGKKVTKGKSKKQGKGKGKGAAT